MEFDKGKRPLEHKGPSDSKNELSGNLLPIGEFYDGGGEAPIGVNSNLEIGSTRFPRVTFEKLPPIKEE